MVNGVVCRVKGVGRQVEGVGLLSIVQCVRLLCSVRLAGPALDAEAPALMSAAERGATSFKNQLFF